MTNIDQEMSGEPTSPVTEPPASVKPKNIMILQAVNAEDVGKRGPGRPRTKVNPSDVKGVKPDQVYPPPPPQSASAIKASQAAEDEAERLRLRKIERKRRETADLQKQIVTEFNDQIIEGLVSIGFPAEFLYKNGTPPLAVANTNYTDLANALCINPSQAHWMARGWVEAKEIPQVQKLIGEGSKSDGPAYLWIGLGALGLFSYAKQLTGAMKIMADIKNQLNQIKAAAEQQQEPQGGPSMPTFSESN